MPWFLRRSPLAPGVPLEGSDTVQGLRTLERLRRAELLPDVGEARGGGGGGGGGNGGWQRAYQRYRGPYLEQLTSADLQAAPKGWALFWRGGERGRAADAYSLPATLAVLRERAEARPAEAACLSQRAGRAAPRDASALRAVDGRLLLLTPLGCCDAFPLLCRFSEWAAQRCAEPLCFPVQENLVAFLPNYLRLAAGVLLACFYLRPRALLGGACLAYSVYRSIAITMRRQLAEAEAQAAVAAAGGGAAGRQAAAAARQRAAAAGDPNEQAVTALLTAVTWVAVAYTRCLPVVALGCCAAALAVGAHAALRRAASEQRYKGRVPLAFSWRQVLGQGEAAPGCRLNTRLPRSVLLPQRCGACCACCARSAGVMPDTSRSLPLAQSPCRQAPTRGDCCGRRRQRRGRRWPGPRGSCGDTAGTTLGRCCCAPRHAGCRRGALAAQQPARPSALCASLTTPPCRRTTRRFYAYTALDSLASLFRRRP
jgi:hypothetical protein